MGLFTNMAIFRVLTNQVLIVRNKPRVSQQVPTHDSLPEKEDAIEIEGASETRNEESDQVR